MTFYLGSKADHADDILKIVLAKRKPGQTFVDAFTGGANVICRVPDADGPRLGADINPYMVALHTALANGWQPPEAVSEKEYLAIYKNQKKYPPELVGFVGSGCTFGSIWFSGYVKPEKDKTPRCKVARNNCLRDAPGLKGASFVCSSYDQLDIPPKSLCYFDPPYVGTKGYVSEFQQNWRAYKFWQWADRLVDDGHTVFVSEYKGPTSEVYPMPPRTPEHTTALDACRKIQADMVALGDAPTPSEMQRAFDEAAASIAKYDRKRIEPCQMLANRWKVVWEKEVRVGLSALNADKDKGEEVKTETEKLFHREA